LPASLAQRFRFECFLTKELSHPHVVILVGVCWDEHMLGLILEFVDGGSLQSRLNQDWSVGHEGGIGDRITWKRELLKWATEAALGCQYVHPR
jgi:serine/threonine protein kinase